MLLQVVCRPTSPILRANQFLEPTIHEAKKFIEMPVIQPSQRREEGEHSDEKDNSIPHVTSPCTNPRIKRRLVEHHSHAIAREKIVWPNVNNIAIHANLESTSVDN
ncbi:hypothetical protein ACFXKD_18710 [Nocardiopsis aegyptia]|uniref:hypothetical protein n=1 Tax=Nocardiopsis aegyptia TaxID=220378 RepID=UPI003670715E